MISLTSPVRTRAHDWPAGAKLAGLCLATAGLFFVTDVRVLGAVLALVLGLYALPGAVFLRAGLRGLRVLWPFVVIVLVWHAVTGAPAQGLAIVLRLVSAVALANLVTMTTTLSDMIAVVHRLAAPLRVLGLPSRTLELAIALVIRMVPVMLERGRLLAQSWSARSARRASWRLVFPFALAALDDADHVADALKARGGLTPSEDR